MLEAGTRAARPVPSNECQKSVDATLARVRKGKLPSAQTARLVGLPDFTGTLRAGEVW